MKKLRPCLTKFAICLSLLLLTAGCKERYDVPFTTPNTGFLVVEGVINPNGETEITLSRTSKLSSSGLIHETGASLEIEGDDNSSYPLTESDSGSYHGPQLTLNNNTNYRLHIRTVANKEYVSEFKKPINTPPIDSISWKRQNGVEIFVNAHDPENKIDYYKWNYDETWEFKTHYISGAQYQFNYNGNIDSARVIHPGIPNTHICWKSRSPSSIMTGSTAALSDKVVYLPIVSYPEASWELSDLYSINLHQYALSKEAYEFYRKLKKNTESLGSIFDAQPTELKGNISCITDPSEQVIGYIEVTSVQTKRKFISNAELPDWNYSDYAQCHTDTFPNYSESVKFAYYSGLAPIDVLLPPFPPPLFYAAPRDCVDCTTRGTNNKPSFWP